VSVALKGSSPAALTAGILLASRARSFGVPLRVEIVGDPAEITPVTGPAVLYSHVLASCGVGRDLGEGALVLVPGPATEPVLACLDVGGLGEWFEVDSSGAGLHPGTQAFVRLARDTRPAAREAARQLSRFLRLHGVPPEPAVLDLAFCAPEQPLTRLALALRAGRAMTGEKGAAVTRWLAPGFLLGDLPDMPESGGALVEAARGGRLGGWLDRLTVPSRFAVEGWLGLVGELSAGDGGRDLALVEALADLFAHLALLPARSMLPVPDAAADAVATGLARVIGATGGLSDANQALAEVFRFLGGKFVTTASFPITLPSPAPPADRLGRWRWFTSQVIDAAEHAESLWRRVCEPQN